MVYDIKDDATRGKLRELLKDYGGERLQYSVYELSISYDTLEKIKPQILALLDEGKGTIHIIKPCNKCYNSIIHISTNLARLQKTKHRFDSTVL